MQCLGVHAQSVVDGIRDCCEGRECSLHGRYGPQNGAKAPTRTRVPKKMMMRLISKESPSLDANLLKAFLVLPTAAPSTLVQRRAKRSREEGETVSVLAVHQPVLPFSADLVLCRDAIIPMRRRIKKMNPVVETDDGKKGGPGLSRFRVWLGCSVRCRTRSG